MKETFAIKENNIFQRAYRKGLRSNQRFIVVYAMKRRTFGDGNEKTNRLGISVSKRFGNSVQRNTFKRYVRESYRGAIKTFVGNYDIVVSARPSKRTAAPNRKLRAEAIPTFAEIDGELVSALKELKVINEGENKS